MSKNMGALDRGLRLLIAVAVAVLWYLGTIDGWVAAVLALLATVFVVTGLVGSCPLYSLVGLSTCKR